MLQAKLSGITTFVQESFSGIRVLKSFASEKHFTAKFQKQSDDYKNQYMKLVQVNALFLEFVNPTFSNFSIKVFNLDRIYKLHMGVFCIGSLSAPSS